MTDKTHYRKAFNSPYLSSADIVEPTILTIARVALEIDQTKKSKEMFNTAYFVEKEIREGEALKPMILNAHNSRIMKDLGQSHFIDDWKNVRVIIYVDSNVRFRGDTVDGLRINPNPPQDKPTLTQDNAKAWGRAIDAYKRDGTLEAVREHMVVSAEDEKLIIEQSNVS